MRRVRGLTAPSPPRPVLLGIDGRSGAGKTAVAQAVTSLLGEAQVVHMDDVYPGWHGLAAGVAALPEMVLIPLRQGGIARFAPFDWATHRAGSPRQIGPCRTVVVEGCGSTCGRAADLLDLRVWLQAPAAARHARAVGRDGPGLAARWPLWRAQEDALFGPGHPWERADLVLRTG